MKPLKGPISDRLREVFPPDAKEWTPPRPGEKYEPGGRTCPAQDCPKR